MEKYGKQPPERRGVPLLSWVDPPDAALYFITAKYGHSWSHFRDTGDGSIFGSVKWAMKNDGRKNRLK